jgi:hypothetical protein
MAQCGITPSELFNHGKEFELAKAAVCEIHNRACLNRKCKVCSTPSTLLRPLFTDWLNDDTHQRISYHKWMLARENIKGKVVSKIKKSLVSGYRWELYHELCEQLLKYPYHMLNAVNQSSAYRKCKESLKPHEVLCVVDFAENYTCRQYAEAQSAYYSRNAVTIHPMVAIFANGGAVSRDSVVIITSDLKHDGSAVKSFVQVFSSHVQVHYPHIEHIIFWSDGCAAQYKSKLPLFNISQSFGISQRVTWNYFGSRHGKGESDGESAVVKTFLNNTIKSEQLTIHDARAVFAMLAHSDRQISDSNSRRHFYFVEPSVIDGIRTALGGKEICSVPQVRSFHQIIGEGGMLKHRLSSCYCVDGLQCWHSSESAKEFRYPGLLLYALLCLLYITWDLI